MEINIADINGMDAGFNLRKAARAITNYFDTILEPTGIRSTQFTLLVTLHKFGAKAASMSFLGKYLAMDRTTLTRNFQLLASKNLIAKVPCKDTRRRAYCLTGAGLEVLQKCIPIWHKTHDTLKEGFNKDRYENMIFDLQALTLEFTHHTGNGAAHL